MIAEDRTGSLLPVLAFEPDQKLFFCADQTLAFGFTCQPLIGGDEKTESRLRVLLEEEWPAGTMMSFCLAASPNIKPFTYSVEGLCNPRSTPILRDAVQDRLAFLQSGADQSNPQTATFVRDFQLIITIKVPIDGVRTPNPQDLECAAGLQRRAEQCLRDVGLTPTFLNPKRYASVLAPFLTGGRMRLGGATVWPTLMISG